MRSRIGTTLTLALSVALAACRTARSASATAGEGPAAPTALRAAAGPGADVELMWQPSPTRGVVYAILDAQGKRVGLTARNRFRVSRFGVKGERCYSVIALDRSDRASRPTEAACLASGDERPPDREEEDAAPARDEARPQDEPPAAPAGEEAHPPDRGREPPAAPGRDDAHPPAPDQEQRSRDQSSRPHPMPRTTSGALAS